MRALRPVVIHRPRRKLHFVPLWLRRTRLASELLSLAPARAA